MSASDYLILNIDNFGENVQRLFKTLEQSDAHRRLFLSDPSGVMLKMLFPDIEFSESGINDTNRLLFAILSNSKFMKWASGYQQKLEKLAKETTKIDDPDEAMRTMTALFDKRKIYADLVEALINSGDKEIVGTIIMPRGTPGSPTNRPPRGKHGTPDGGFQPPVCVQTATAVVAIQVAFVVSYIAIGAISAAAIAIHAFIGRTVGGIEGVSRDDLLKLSASIAEQLDKKASDLRQSGTLSL